MNLLAFRGHFKEKLKGLYPKDEIQSIEYLLLEHHLGLNRVEVALSPNTLLTDTQIDGLQGGLRRLQNEEPIQYILGSTEFCGLRLQVNPFTLIPRPETEELVSWAIDSIHLLEQSRTAILDIGTGSGCIAIALAKALPEAKVEAIDISQPALETAYQNASHNGTRVTFYEQDILEATHVKNYDIIISNPPYVRELEKEEIHKNVLDNEPSRALFVSDSDPLVFYRKIGALAFENLSERGMVFFEINEYLGKETSALLKKIGFGRVELRKDLFGKDRMIRAQR